MRKTENDLKEQQQDDYSQLLPLFIYPDEKESQALYPQMDKAIEKCSEVIDRHSIYIRNKEHVKWINDCFFLIGKARFYKKEYELAKETFLYVYQAYKNDPLRYEGLLWLIRSNIETEDWEEVEKFIDIIEDDISFPEDLKGNYHTVYADYLLKRKADYAAASEQLEQAILLIKKKKNKVRKAFVLAQLYQLQREYGSATRLYTDVISMRPGYTMEFNAKINRAIAFDVENNNSEDIRKQLLKMLRDEKNIEFKDQIYFALAELELKHGNDTLGISYLKKSAASSTSNTKQKALSYLRLANIYFEMPEYMDAKAYYDSTIQFLPKEHPEYYEADEKSNSLEDLVANLKTIQIQDSLLKLSNMDAESRIEFVENLIKKKKEAVEKQRIAEQIKAERQQAEALTRAGAASNQSGEWYFYNQTTLALGRADFKNTWGNRELRDNWRWIDEGSNFGNSGAARGPLTSAGSAPDFSSEIYNVEFYLQTIPTKPNEIYAAHQKLSQALFNAGTIFRESFANYPKAIASFKRIIREYDTSKLNLPSHYQLYRIYVEQANEEMAEIEKQWVLENHPFSEYAYLIKNPNYNKNKQETREKIEAFYAATYNLYGYGLYEDVIESINKADSIFPENHIQAKFDLLRAKAIGYSRTKEDLKKALEEIVASYPNDSVKIEAQRILSFMGNTAPAVEKVSYKMNPIEPHYFIVSLDSKGPAVREIQNQLSNFNSSFFRESGLAVRLVPFKSKSFLLVRAFKDQKEAMRYFRTLKSNEDIMEKINKENGNVFLISNSNYSTLLSEKNEKAYLQFYKNKYPT